MDKKTKKKILNTIIDIIGIGTTEFGFDGFFQTQQIDNSLTQGELEDLLENNPEWTPYQFYEYTLLPLISKNPTKHQSINWIYNTLANACPDEVLKRNYFEKRFKHMILSRLDGVKDVDGADSFYAMVLIRESCCSLCKRFDENEIYEFDKVLNELPALVRNCEHECSCHAAVCVMSNYRYDAYMKRRKH